MEAILNLDAYESLNLRRDGRILYVTLNRPDELNAVNQIMHDELAQVFYDLQQDTESDLIVLTGAGRAFCAGGDLAWMQDTLQRRDEEFLSPSDAKRIVFSMLDLEKPVIARVNGAAVGLGATLALLCDIIIADERAKIGDPHVKAGVVAGDGGAVLWPQLIGYARAKEFLFTGDLMTGAEAARIGLISHAVAADSLDTKVAEMAEKILAMPRWAVRWTKVSVNVGLKQLAHSIMDTSLAYEWITFSQPDHAEAVAAFTEGRKPQFNKPRG